MPNYILPQVVINQLFSEVALNTIKNQNCLVFGPNYQLFRYSDEAVRGKIQIGTIDGSVAKNMDGLETKEFKYPEFPDNASVDTGYTKLYADNAVVAFGTAVGFVKLDDKEAGSDLDGRIKFMAPIAGRYRDTDSNDEDSNADTHLDRDVSVGDIVVMTSGDKRFESVVLEVFASDKSLPERYDSVRIEDTLPDWLDDSAETASQSVEFLASLRGVEVPRKSASPGDWQWTSGDESFTIDENGNLTVEYLGSRRDVARADLYVEYRALLLGAADAIHSIERSSSVSSMLGDIVPDNPLAFAVSKCAQNSADRVVYYMATMGTSTEDYERVLEAASKTDDVYFLVPLSQDDDVIDAVVAHVKEMSGKENKRWRVAFVCADVPETKTLYTKAETSDGKGFFAVFEPPQSLPQDGNVIMRFLESEDSDSPSTVTRCVSQLRAGDEVRVYGDIEVDAWGDPVYTRCVVDKVLSNTVVRLRNGPELGAVYRVEAVHRYTNAEMTTAVASTSRALMTRRAYNVFPTFAQESDGTTYSGVHLAAASAGLASSVLPQQPITNVELTGIDDVPACYNTYTRTQLNEIAAGGTFIVMQDLPGDRVYIRHQISTEYSGNNLLKSELSITKNLDSISYYFAEAYRPYIGRYNITPALIEVLRSVAENALDRLESETGAGLYGPQVLPEGTEITQLYQDPVNQDHVYMHLKLNLPRPFNVLDLDLEVI